MSALERAETQLLRVGDQWYADWQSSCKPAAQGPNERGPAVKVTNVDIGDGLHIRMAESTRVASGADDTPLVCMHGFGTGLGIYYAALPALAERWRGKVYAIDTLGCGLSSRPRWTLGHGKNCRVDDAEAYFISGLEQWREAMKLDRMVLMGHSLGGYLAVAYAEKYPSRVERLVLVSAVGTPAPPPELAEAQRTAAWPIRAVLSAWESGWSPFTVAKLGVGDALMGRYVSRRFSDASWVKKPELQAYLASSWVGANNSAGGYAHATLLRPGGVGELAYARTPMGPSRIPSLAVPRIAAIYGDRDWMDWRNMAKVREAIEARRQNEGSKGGPQIEIMHVADASHNVQVDNPLGFVDAVLAACDHGRGSDGKVFGAKYVSGRHEAMEAI